MMTFKYPEFLFISSIFLIVSLFSSFYLQAIMASPTTVFFPLVSSRIGNLDQKQQNFRDFEGSGGLDLNALRQFQTAESSNEPLKQQPRLFFNPNSFNLTAVILGAPNNTASLTFVPLSTLLFGARPAGSSSLFPFG